MNSPTTTLFPSANFYIDRFRSLPLRAGKKLRLLALCGGKGRRCAGPTVSSHVDGLVVAKQKAQETLPKDGTMIFDAFKPS